MAMNIEPAGWLADYVASSLTLDDEEAQDLLGTLDVRERLEKLSIHLAKELDVLELQGKIHSRVQEELDKSQREYFLREQMKAIQRELGETDPRRATRSTCASASRGGHAGGGGEEGGGRAAADGADPVGVARGRHHPHVPGVAGQRAVAEGDGGPLDLKDAAKVLDRHHYGLPKVKERILEYMAVRQLAKDKRRSPILCLVGPPGVGKTSLGRSIAEALGPEVRAREPRRHPRRGGDPRAPPDVRRRAAGAVIHGMRQAGDDQSRLHAR